MISTFAGTGVAGSAIRRSAGAMLFFQLLTHRYEQASTVLTSNKGFEEWGEIFGDDVMAAAIIDRLVHHCHIVTIRGNSYRMRQHTDLWHAVPTPDPEPPSSRPRRPRLPTCEIVTQGKSQILARR